jgi:hypothetical protein
MRSVYGCLLAWVLNVLSPAWLEVTEKPLQRRLASCGLSVASSFIEATFLPRTDLILSADETCLASLFWQRIGLLPERLVLAPRRIAERRQQPAACGGRPAIKKWLWQGRQPPR